MASNHPPRSGQVQRPDRRTFPLHTRLVICYPARTAMLVVYGATGYTGRLITLELSERGVSFAIAGRSQERLDTLRRELGRTGRMVPELIVADIDDEAALDRLAERATVVMHAAGPFERTGPQMVRACLRGRAHYLDIAGETPFMLSTAARHDEALARGVALVNAVGFDVVPSDLAAHLASAALGETPERVELGVRWIRPKTSVGSKRSVLALLGSGGIAIVDGHPIPEPLARAQRRFAFPEVEGEIVTFSAPIADLATLPRTTGAKNARTFVVMSRSLGRCTRVASPLLKSWLGRGAMAAYAKTLPAPGRGPAPEERMASRFAFVAEAFGRDRVARATVSGADPYGLTAHTASHVAVAFLERGTEKSGALSPMQALDPAEWRSLLDHLGCEISVDPS